ncbi:MAG: esterase-like activity of phytase family protein [Kiritimatiellae bacterium]|nr:esterase-like activity of phytase family protein [Kiritimatiellia bacterium]
MNKAGCAAVLAASVALSAFSAEADIKISSVSFLERPVYLGPEGDRCSGGERFKFLGLSGLAYAGGDTYYAVDDGDGYLYQLTIPIERETGRIKLDDSYRRKPYGTNGFVHGTAEITFMPGVRMSDANDMEGCAYDPASGKLWIAQEKDALIREYDPATGKISRSAPVPEVLKDYYENLSLEALTISGNGKVMWTCNEESLKCDGPFSSENKGTIVRLTRFTRKSVYDNWTPAGQWPYLTEPVGTPRNGISDPKRSGVAGMCLLPDGTLLVLERRCYGDPLCPNLQFRIYKADFTGATEISSVKSLKGLSSFNCVGKGIKPLWDSEKSGFLSVNYSNFECMCLGPRLNDGSCVLVLASDGNNGGCIEKVMTLRLEGLNIHTLNVRRYTYKRKDGGHVWGFSQQNYRYLDGQQVTMHNIGEGIAPTAHTNKGARVYTSEWKLPAHGIYGRKGAVATFYIKKDDTLWWDIQEAGFAPSASIMVAPSAASGAAALGGQAYTVSTAVPAPVAAPATASVGLAASAAEPSATSAVPAPAITGFGITSAKLPRIEFIGYVGGVEYRVLCSSTIDFRNATAIAGRIVETRIDEDDKGVVAVWEGDKPDSPASGAKFYRVEVVEAAAE